LAFPTCSFCHGDEPDPRFSLANERTFLAWIRTAMSFVLAGIALEALDPPVLQPLRVIAAGIFVFLGLISSLYGFATWAISERALRNRAPLPGLAFGSAISAGAAVAVILVIVGFLCR
jgi:putative membrane protein